MPAPVSSAYGIELGSNTCVFVCLFGFAFRDCGYNLSCRLRKEDLWYNDLWNEPRSGELRTQKLKSHLVRTHSLNVLPLKLGVSQHIAIHATLTARDFFLAYFYTSGPFTCIFSKTSPDFSLCWLWLTHGSCVGPQNKISHPAGCRFPY